MKIKALRNFILNGKIIHADEEIEIEKDVYEKLSKNNTKLFILIEEKTEKKVKKNAKKRNEKSDTAE